MIYLMSSSLIVHINFKLRAGTLKKMGGDDKAVAHAQKTLSGKFKIHPARMFLKIFKLKTLSMPLNKNKKLSIEKQK